MALNASHIAILATIVVTAPVAHAAQSMQRSLGTGAPVAAQPREMMEAKKVARPLQADIDALTSGRELTPGQMLISIDKRYRVRLLADGSLVINEKPSGSSTETRIGVAGGTEGRGGVRLVMQSDGNLVLLNQRGLPVWSTNTAGHPGAELKIQNDGNLVIYHAGRPLWSTGTDVLAEGPCDYGPGAALKPVGLIGDAWFASRRSLPPVGALGCPMEAEHDVPGRSGRVQSFQFGQVAWSPGNGNKAVIVAYQAGNDIEVMWANTQPYTYQLWLVRTESEGRELSQGEVSGPNVWGWYVMRSASPIPGTDYTFLVKGCDANSILGANMSVTCKQDWMIPVTVALKPNPPKSQSTLPDPPPYDSDCAKLTNCINKAIDAAKTVVEIYQGAAAVAAAVF